MSITMKDIPDIPDGKQYADHPLHREAKRKAMKDKSRKRPGPIITKPTLVRCPGCGEWFDPTKYTTEDKT